MKITNMKTLISMHDEWTKLKRDLHFVYDIYETNYRKTNKHVSSLNKDETENMATKFLKIVASLYNEEYDAEYQSVDFHLDFGTYILVFDSQVHADNPCFLGLRMSSYVEENYDMEVTQEEVKQFFDDNVGTDFRDVTIE